MVQSGQTELATQVVGDGDPVVFLHAAVCDRRMWHDQILAVSKAGYRAIAYDRRGYGETRMQAEAHSPITDLMAVLDAVAPGKRAVLVGCSQGGRYALDAALCHPERVRGLVLIDNSVSGAPDPIYPAEIARIMLAADTARSAGDIDRLNALLARMWLDGISAAEHRVSGPARDLFLDMNGRFLRSPPVGKNLTTETAYDRLDQIAVPVQVLYGDLDFPHIQERCRYVAAAVQNGAVKVVHGAAHLPSLEQPAIVSRAVLDLIARCGE